MNSRVITYEPKAAPRDAPPLLFVHGAYVGGWCWAENFLPYFAELGYRTHAIDLYRHSRGRLRFTPHASLSDYIEEIESSIASLGESPVLIGHSMGGYLVQKYIAQRSAPAAILMASVPPQGLLPATAWLALTNPCCSSRFSCCNGSGHRPCLHSTGSKVAAGRCFRHTSRTKR